jgi:hypothetical protein
VEPDERGWDWYWICIAAWAAMMGAWMAAADVLGLPRFTLRCGVLLVGAFPFAYYLHFSRVSRDLVNWAVLAAAVALGLLDMAHTWRLGALDSMESLGSAYRTLIGVFLWITVMRAFALRTLSDMLETVVPVGSILLLVLVSQPSVIAVVGTSLALMGSVALMAAAHEATWAARARGVQALVGTLRPNLPSANSWPTVYVFALVTAIVAAQGLRSADLTGMLGRQLQIQMARVLAKYMLRYRADYVSGEPRLYMSMPAPTSNRPMFEVEADQGANWRLSAYTYYDGWSWSSGFRGTHASSALSPGTYELPVSPGGGKSPSGERMIATFRARVPMGGSVPAVFWPRWVTNERLERPSHARVDALGNLWFSRYVRPGDSYTVIAVRPTSGTEPKKLGNAMLKACLQLPEDLPPRVKRLAKQIAGARQSISSKCNAIAQFLALQCRYDEFPDFPSRGQDAIDYFLFSSKRGYCVHFAAAFVILCRAVGIPARLVTGFLEGDLQEGSKTYVVRAKDAHAWAEVFVPNTGWVEYDPTPPRPLTTAEVAAQTWDRMTTALSRAIAATGTWIYTHIENAVLLITLATLLSWAYKHYRWQETLRVRVTAASPRRQVQVAYRQMVAWLTSWGRTPSVSATPLEFARDLGEEWGQAQDAAVCLAWLYTRSLYAPSGVRQEDADLAITAAETIRDRWIYLRRRLRLRHDRPCDQRQGR